MPEENIMYEASINFSLHVANKYANDMKFVEDMLLLNEPYRYCMKGSYNELVKHGDLLPLKQLSEETKKELLERSYEYWPDKIDKYIRIVLCECLFLLNYLFEKYSHLWQ